MPPKKKQRKLLGAGKGVQNPRAVASVMAVRAGEHAQDLSDALERKRASNIAVLQSQSHYDVASAMYGLQLSRGNISGAEVAKAQMQTFRRQKADARKMARQMSWLAPDIQSSVNSVVVELSKHCLMYA